MSQNTRTGEPWAIKACEFYTEEDIVRARQIVVEGYSRPIADRYEGDIPIPEVGIRVLQKKDGSELLPLGGT